MGSLIVNLWKYVTQAVKLYIIFEKFLSLILIMSKCIHYLSMDITGSIVWDVSFLVVLWSLQSSTIDFSSFSLLLSSEMFDDSKRANIWGELWLNRTLFLLASLGRGSVVDWDCCSKTLIGWRECFLSYWNKKTMNA